MDEVEEASTLHTSMTYSESDATNKTGASGLHEMNVPPEATVYIGRRWCSATAQSLEASRPKRTKQETMEVLNIGLMLRDGDRTPTLVAFYAPVSLTDVNKKAANMEPGALAAEGCDWSPFSEVKTWIDDENASRRNTRSETRRLRERAFVKEGGSIGLGSGLSTNNDVSGYVLNDVIGRAVLPDGSVVYEVTYVVSDKDVIKCWEKESDGDLKHSCQLKHSCFVFTSIYSSY